MSAHPEPHAAAIVVSRDRATLPQFRNPRAFLIWALMCGYTKPERVVERVVAELKLAFEPSVERAKGTQ
jgi:hypothetical protein